MTKEECIGTVKTLRAKHGLEASNEDLIATIHIMNRHGLDVHAALDQSSRGGNDHGVDGWHYDQATRELFIYQSKLSESKATALKGFADLDRGREWVEQVIVEGVLDAVPSNNACLYNLYTTLSSARKTLTQIKFVLISIFDQNELEDKWEWQEFENAAANSRLNLFVRNELSGHITVSSEVYLLRGGLAPRKPYSIEKIPEAKLQLRSNSYMDLAYVPLHSLVKLYRQRGDVLFEKNVRMSLGETKEAKNRLVHPMTATLEQITRGQLSPALFGFYHVGVTLTAATSHPDLQNQVTLEAPTVVNGCQTINIANEFLKRLEKQNDLGAIKLFEEIKVIVKVVVGISNDELKEITNANNRQNPIENWQLFSNEPVHVELESALKDAGVFYERQKGKFDAVMKKAEIAMHYGSTNGTYLKVLDLAQVIALAKGNLPFAAKPSEIFATKGNHDAVFDITVLQCVNDAILCSNLLKAIKRGLNNYLGLAAHANSYAPAIFNKASVRMHVFRLALLHFYQNPGLDHLRKDYSYTLTKNASQTLVQASQPFFLKIVSKVKNWYVEESREMSVEVSSKKLDSFFMTLATGLRIDTDGRTPFTSKAIDWAA